MDFEAEYSDRLLATESTAFGHSQVVAQETGDEWMAIEPTGYITRKSIPSSFKAF